MGYKHAVMFWAISCRGDMNPIWIATIRSGLVLGIHPSASALPLSHYRYLAFHGLSRGKLEAHVLLQSLIVSEIHIYQASIPCFFLYSFQTLATTNTSRCIPPVNLTPQRPSTDKHRKSSQSSHHMTQPQPGLNSAWIRVCYEQEFTALKWKPKRDKL